MTFTSYKFFIFFPVVLLINYIAQKFNLKIRNIVLLICNFVFYLTFDYRFSLLLITMILVTYYSSKHLDKKSFYLLGILYPIVTLCFFKYFNFFITSIGFNSLNIILPAGISFYSFEAISYLVDIKKGKIDIEDNFINLATYLSFFPNIVSGPIVRASCLLVQIKNDKKINYENISIGIQIMMFGYFKKMVLADRLSVFVSDVYSNISVYNWLTILLAIFSYSIQIYMDFSGYSDIAIGCARCLGIDFERNFNLPYISKTVGEFWRRWHISLSSWFRDYIYIPLGGNRKGIKRTMLNSLIVMTISGLWHGANWTYILWGLVNGILLCLERIVKLDKLNKNIRIVLTFIVMSFTWIIFRANSFANMVNIFKAIFTLQNGLSQPYTWSFFSFIVLIISTSTATRKSMDDRVNGYYPIQNLKTIKGLTLFLLLCGFTLCLAYTNSSPFVYVQF